MTPCPHPDALLVGGGCYWCLKQKALNGSRSKLSEEQLAFTGFLPERPPERGWVPAWTVVPAFDGTEDRDPEATRGIVYSMRAPDRHERLELSV